MKYKTTQQQMAFYKLYEERKKDPERYVAIWEFVGEIFIKPTNKWELMSYTCPHRVFEVYQENPDLIERKMLIGKSGAHYYGYRLNINVSVEYIKDEKLKDFYKLIKTNDQRLKLSEARRTPTVEGVSIPQ